jgi:perosamine synthetase
MIPLYKPYVGKKEVDAVIRVIKSNKFTRGKEVEKFEKNFAKYTKQKYAIAVNSGTSGLHLAVRAMGWKKGDEIITTPFSFIASSNSLLFEDVTPVFVDIDPSNLNIDITKIEKKITKNTKGILLVHLFGLPVDITEIKKLKKKYKLQIIEDACEAIGTPNNEFTVTNAGELSIYSFHENKEITSGGEGGMITTNNPELARICRSMREHGRASGKDWLENVILGFNFRMTEMQAAFGDVQLKSLNKILRKNSNTAKKYHSLIKGTPGIKTQTELGRTKRGSFTYFVLFDDPDKRTLVHEALTKAGIGSSTNYFPPINKFPHHRKNENEEYKHTEYISKRLLVLPLFYEITENQIKEVVSVIKRTLK